MTSPTDQQRAALPGRSTTLLAPSKAASRKSAYTLVEILLVVAIITIATIVTTPYLVRSIRGNRLRAATSNIIMAGKYARSMALLKQQNVTLTFDMAATSIAVTFNSTGTTAPPPASSSNTSARADAPSAAPSETAAPAEDDDEQLSRGGQNPNVKRIIDGITFTYIETETEGRKTEGIVVIGYESNGRCEPYTVHIEDEHGEGTTIKIDALATASTTD